MTQEYYLGFERYRYWVLVSLEANCIGYWVCFVVLYYCYCCIQLKDHSRSYIVTQAPNS